MDYLDFLVDTSDEYMTGYYYKRRPKNALDGRISFKYKQLDPNSRVFDKLLGDVRADSATYAIKTNDKCGFAVGGYIVTQNGLFWEISSVITNEEPSKDKDVLRFFRVSKRAECNIRMLAVDNLYDVAPTYISQCDIKVALRGRSGTGQTAVEYTVPIRSATVTAHIGGGDETVETVISPSGELFFAVEKGVSVTVEYNYTLNGEDKTGSTYFTQVDTTKPEINYVRNVTEVSEA